MTYSNKIITKCEERNDKWASEVEARVISAPGDLHACDAQYHKDCYRNFHTDHHAPGSDTKNVTETPSCGENKAPKELIQIMRSDKDKIWNSVMIDEKYKELGGTPIRRDNLLRLICAADTDVISLSSPGYTKLIMFKTSSTALVKCSKDESDGMTEEESITVLSKAIKRDLSEIAHDKDRYRAGISKTIAAEYTSRSLSTLLQTLSPALDEQSLPALLIGNIVTSVVNKIVTPLQIALGVHTHRKS